MMPLEKTKLQWKWMSMKQEMVLQRVRRTKFTNHASHLTAYSGSSSGFLTPVHTARPITTQSSGLWTALCFAFFAERERRLGFKIPNAAIAN